MQEGGKDDEGNFFILYWVATLITLSPPPKIDAVHGKWGYTKDYPPGAIRSLTQDIH